MWDDLKDMLDRENDYDDTKEIEKILYPEYDYLNELDDDSDDDDF